MIEFVIVFPIVLVILFVLIQGTMAINAKYALRTAVTNAARLAYTRGNGDILGTIDSRGVIPAIDQYLEGGGCDPQMDSIFRLGDGIPGSGCDALQTFFAQQAACSPFPNCAVPPCELPNDYPKSYSYFVAYALLGMREGLGGSVRYPCDPMIEENDGCFSCDFLNPDATTGGPDGCGDASEDPAELPVIYVRCRYRPIATVLNPIYRLLRMSSGDDNWGVMEVEWHYP